MQKEIYIIRHGQTDFNLKGIVQGRGVDSSLNNAGQQQAQAFYQQYKDIPFEHLYISELKRTYETTESFIKAGLGFTKLPSLDEINWGIYEGVAHSPEMKDEYMAIIEQWRQNDLSIKIKGGESAQDLANRQAPFVERLKSMPYQKVLVCSHGRSIRALMCSLTGTPLKDMDDFSHYNTCLYKVLLNENQFTIELANNTDHLSEELKQMVWK